MAKRIENEVAYYYDFHPTEEDLMGETSVHAALVHYLIDVLTWLLQGQRCAVYENLNFYQTPNPKEYPLAPDIAVIKGVDFQHVRSWRVGRTGPAPQVVFEIASEETWKKDLMEKPGRYAFMGVEEYFAYDPNELPLRREGAQRLFGWQLDRERRVMREMPVGPDGGLWSAHLESVLLPDGEHLRLYDRQGQLRLTQTEAQAKRAEIETTRAQIEAKRAEREARRAEIEAKRAQREARRAQSMAEKLRSLGIDPDQL
jgi:Uma2 family endonuclease